METIDDFRDFEFSFLANDYACTIKMDGQDYPSVEHAFQASKTNNEFDRILIRQAKTAHEAKKIGRGVYLRDDWDDIRVDVMLDLIKQKFKNDELEKKLMKTGDAELVFKNTIGDRFWGVCKGRGDNHLGEILMKVRNTKVQYYYQIICEQQDKYLKDCGWTRTPDGDYLWDRCYAAPWDDNEWFSMTDALKQQERIVMSLFERDELSDDDDDDDDDDYDDDDLDKVGEEISCPGALAGFMPDPWVKEKKSVKEDARKDILDVLGKAEVKDESKWKEPKDKVDSIPRRIFPWFLDMPPLKKG